MSNQTSNTMPGWWARLFGGAPSEAGLRLERMEQQLADLSVQIEGLRSIAGIDGAYLDPAPFREALSALEKQIARAGREQLKANSIAEAQSEQLAAALEQLRAADARREVELVAQREQQRSAQAAIRLEMAQTLLPALDSLDEALRAGRLLLAVGRQPTKTTRANQANTARRVSIGSWLQRLLNEPAPEPAPDDTIYHELAELRAGIESWLAGLGFVRQRLLDALQAQGVRPIVAAGQPFDPNYQVAIGVVPPTASHPAGVVVEELRRGYLAGERLLRHAEVVVAGAEHQPENEQEGTLT